MLETDQRLRTEVFLNDDTSKETNCSARASDFATCQNILLACLHPNFVGALKVYDSKSGPPLGRTIIA